MTRDSSNLHSCRVYYVDKFWLQEKDQIKKSQPQEQQQRNCFVMLFVYEGGWCGLVGKEDKTGKDNHLQRSSPNQESIDVGLTGKFLAIGTIN